VGAAPVKDGDTGDRGEGLGVGCQVTEKVIGGEEDGCVALVGGSGCEDAP